MPDDKKSQKSKEVKEANKTKAKSSSDIAKKAESFKSASSSKSATKARLAKGGKAVGKAGVKTYSSAKKAGKTAIETVQKAGATYSAATDSSKSTEANAVKLSQTSVQNVVSPMVKTATVAGKTIALTAKGGTKATKVILKRGNHAKALKVISGLEKGGKAFAKVGKATGKAVDGVKKVTNVAGKVPKPFKTLASTDGDIEKNVANAVKDTGKESTQAVAGTTWKTSKKVAKKAGKKAVKKVTKKKAEKKAVKEASKGAVKATKGAVKGTKNATKTADTAVKTAKNTVRAAKISARIAQKAVQLATKVVKAVAKAVEEVVTFIVSNPIGWIIGIVAVLVVLIVMIVSLIPGVFSSFTQNFSLGGIPEWYLSKISSYTIDGNVTAYSFTPKQRKKYEQTGERPKTSTNVEAGTGFVAVDPNEIPYGSILYVPGYGMAVAADTGGFTDDDTYSDNRIVDVWFETDNECTTWGKQWLTVYVLEEGTGSVDKDAIEKYLKKHPITRGAIGGAISGNISSDMTSPEYCENHGVGASKYGGINTCNADGTPLFQGSALPNCASWVWARVYQEHNVKLNSVFGASASAASSKTGGRIKKVPIDTATIKAGDYIIWGQSGGHVAFVESVSGDVITISESGKTYAKQEKAKGNAHYWYRTEGLQGKAGIKSHSPYTPIYVAQF